MISARPAHAAIVREADYVAAQDASAPRGPAGLATRRYLLAGLLQCGWRLESARSDGKPAYRGQARLRQRHLPGSGAAEGPVRPEDLYALRT